MKPSKFWHLGLKKQINKYKKKKNLRELKKKVMKKKKIKLGIKRS